MCFRVRHARWTRVVCVQDLQKKHYCFSFCFFLQLQTDAEKHSAVKQTSNWSHDLKRSERGSDGDVKMETASRWNHRTSDFSDESERSSTGRKTPIISQTGSWRRGMSAQMAVTSPRTKTMTNCGSLKSHGKYLCFYFMGMTLLYV